MKKTILSIIAFFLFITIQLNATIEAGSPTIFCSVNSLSDFKYTVGSGPSVEQAFTISAENLTSNLVVTAPTNYEISPLLGTSFISMNNITIAHSAGIVSDIVLYVRLKQGLSANSYIGNISSTSVGATTKNIVLSGNVMNPPSISTSVTSITGLFNFYNIGQSVIKSFVVSGTDLKSGIIITPPYNFEISTTGSSFTNSAITLPFSGSTFSPTTIYVRLNPSIYPSYNYTGNLSISTVGAVTKTVTLEGRSSYKPSITTSKSAISGLNYFASSGPSAEQLFTLNGNDMMDVMVVTAPTNFEISKTGGSSFVGQSSLTFNATNYMLGTTTVYVRLKAGLTANSYSGNLTCESSNATTKTIALSGIVSNKPVLNVTGSPVSGLNYNLNNGPSVDKSFTVSGSSLSSLVFVYAPANFEISTTSGSAFSATNAIILPQSGGNVGQTTIYVRLKAGLNVGNYNENVIVASTGATNQTVSLSGMVIDQFGLTVSETAFTGLDYLSGSGPSADKLFTVSGNSINSIVIITAPTNFELSTYSGASFQGSNQLILQPVYGVIYTKSIFVRLKSELQVGTYTGNITVSTAGYATKSLSLTGKVSTPVVLTPESAYYEPRNNGTLTFSNNWLFSRNIGNYVNLNDQLGAEQMVRSMTVRNGKMLFCNRSNGNQIVSVDGVTGIRNTLTLANNVFTYIDRNKTYTADSVYSAVTPCNDIKVDNSGNVLVGNMITNGTLHYQIWKIDMATGNGSVLIDQKDLDILFPGRLIRFDYFNVSGNVNDSAFIYAVCTSLNSVREMYRWTITNGVASPRPEIIPLDKAQDPAFGSSIMVCPIDNENFYFDGDKTYPFKYNIRTGINDSFKNYSAIVDSVTMPGRFWKMSQNINGIKEFKIGDETFLIVAATNNSFTSLYPSSTFRIFKYPKNNNDIGKLQCLWSFPQAGMGNGVQYYRAAIPEVEVNGDKATIYVYYGENGYGVYELTSKPDGTYTNVEELTDKITLHIAENNIVSNKMLERIEVYSLTGQLLRSAVNTMSVQKPGIQGVYIVKMNNGSGVQQSQKIVIR
ncbi:MAG: T9SS type A sorting domain-containing protein [Paludibacter sp.]|nr:T9SS type A sorting domain-containing protein [Paludibacter sp.]